MTKKNLFECSPSEENNVTKALINVLEDSESFILKRFLKSIGIQNLNLNNVIFKLNEKSKYEDKTKGKTIPDAWIIGRNFVICIENKIYEDELYKEQLLGHIEQLSKEAQKKKFFLGIAKSKSHAEALKCTAVKNLAKRKSVKLVFAGWHEEITRFILDELRVLKPAQKAYLLLSNFKDYLGELGMLKISGFDKKDLNSLNIDKNPKKENRIVMIRKNIIPKLEIIRDMLEPVFRSYKLPANGYFSQYQWRSKADAVWIAFSKQRKGKSAIIHYSLVITDDRVSFILHLRPGKNQTNLVKHIEKNGSKKLLELLRDLGKKSKYYKIEVHDDNYISEDLTGISEDKLKYILDMLKAYPHEAKMNVARDFLWKNKSDTKIIKNGNKLLDELYKDIELLKPVFEYIHSFSK